MESRSEGLAPWGEGLVAVASWIPARLYHVLAHFLVFLDQEFGILAAPLALLAVLGLVPLWRKHRERSLLLLAPVLAALFGGLSGLYPMRHRLAIHAGAPLVVLALFGCSAIMVRRSRWAKAGGAILGVIAVLPMPVIILLQSRPPLRSPDTRAVLEVLATRLDDGERVYAYCYAEPAAEYYGPGAGIPGWETLDCPDAEQEVEQMMGAIEPGRAWFFYTDVPERVWSDVAIRALADRGAELDRITDPWVGAEASETAAVLFELR